MLRILILMMLLTQAGNLGYGQDKRASVVTNGELTAGKEFHLLLIHDGGQLSQHIAAMLTLPRSQMVEWVRMSNVRLMHVNEPQAMEHHADLLQKHQGQMPILALVQQTDDDGRGAVWCSVAGQQTPTDEASMAGWLARYFQATGKAAMQANQLAVVADPRVLQQEMQNASRFDRGPGGSYFMPRNSAPEPYTPTGGGRRPFFNPQLDVSVPDTLNTAVGLNPETRLTLIFVGVLAIVCCLLLGASPIISAVIIGHALTDDDDGPNRPSPPSAVNV